MSTGTTTAVRVILPAHLRAMAKVQGEVHLDVAGEVTQRSVLDALEGEFPEVRRQDDPDHGSTWASTESTGGRSRTIGAQLSPPSGEA